LESPKEWDLLAAGRIASRVEFRDIRLSEITAFAPTKGDGALDPQIEHHCRLTKHDGDLLEVLCSYELRVASGGNELLRADIKFLASYTLLGDGPADPNDLDHFAFTNGTYHSWPFVRQLVFDLTARMGYAPYNLPVFKFFPKRPKPVVESQTAVEESASVEGIEEHAESSP
jgi:preprotein translocase subunit SecB